MGKVEVSLNVKTQGEDRIKDLARDLAALAKLPGVSSSDSQRLKDYAQSVRSVRDEYQSANGAAFSLFEKSKGIATSALGGAGLGRYAALAGAAGVTSAVAAAAGIVAQLARMQYTFLETTTRGAATLSIGSDNFRRNLSAIQGASFAGVGYGIAQNQMAAALMTYGSATGAVPDAGFAGSLARYSRGSGIDVNSLAGGIGSIAQFGGDPKKIIRDAFDEAMTAGAFGRRFLEFTQAIAGLTQTLIIQNPGMSGSAAAEMATRTIGNLASLGGSFATPSGNTAGLNALSALGNVQGNPALLSLGLQAGIPQERLLLGNLTPDDELKIAQRAQQIFGKNPVMAEAFASQFGSAAPDVLALMQRGVGANLNAPPKKSYNASSAAAMVNATDYGTISNDIAGIVSPLQATAGQGALTNVVIPALNTVKNIADAFVKDPQGMERDAEAAAIALLAVQVAGNAGIIGNLAKVIGLLGGGETAAGAAGAAGVGAAVLGAGALFLGADVLATTASGGNANESQRLAIQEQWHKAGVRKPSGLSDGDWATLVKVGLSTGVNPDLLASIDYQESTFGKGLTRQGTNSAGNAFGRFQLTAGAGKYGSLDNRLRAAHDYEFAATIAAEMIQENLKQHGGNLGAALDEYGPPSSQLGGKDYGNMVETRFINFEGKRIKVETTLSIVGANRASVHDRKGTALKRKVS